MTADLQRYCSQLAGRAVADMCSRLGDEASTDLSQAAGAQTRKVPPKRPSNPTSSVEARKTSKKKKYD
jgi:hypothetical protein